MHSMSAVSIIMKNGKGYMNEIKSKVEIPTEQHKTDNLFQDFFHVCRIHL